MTEYPIIRANRRMSPLYIIAADLFIIGAWWFIPDILHIHLIIPKWQFVAYPILFMFFHIGFYYLTWPTEINITRSGVRLVYKHMNDKFIPWESIEKTKLSRVYSSVQYNINGKTRYFSLWPENIRLIEQEWEKWKARREDAQ